MINRCHVKIPIIRNEKLILMCKILPIILSSSVFIVIFDFALLQEYQFDFFNYAGIHRPVKLYTVPKVSIGNIVTSYQVGTDLINSAINYDITVNDATEQREADINATVNLQDKEGKVVKTVQGLSGIISLANQHLWWPVGMNNTVGYLHTLEVTLTSGGSAIDVYRLPVGIRTVLVSGTTFLINHKPFYFHGFGRHEDWNVRGKGMDWTMIVKDFNMIDWLGANAFRTSHYPYSEEIMQMCDERGIVVIDECPAVGMRTPDNFVNKTLQHHLEVMKELVSRDMNHPSVVMWSIANEPASNLQESEPYFKVNRHIALVLCNVYLHSCASDTQRIFTTHTSNT